MEPNLTTDYEQTLAYFHTLHDVRFKLLGFLPVLTGIAVATTPDHTTRAQQLALACLGLMVTLGLASYDQRNTQIYDRLILRVRFLERQLCFPPLPGDTHGGPFHCRPPVQSFLGMRLVWHPQGLTLVYSASITGWCFLGVGAIASTHLVIALSSSFAFIASYILLRWVTSKHHKATKHMAHHEMIGGMEGSQ